MGEKATTVRITKVLVVVLVAINNVVVVIIITITLMIQILLVNVRVVPLVVKREKWTPWDAVFIVKRPTLLSDI